MRARGVTMTELLMAATLVSLVSLGVGAIYGSSHTALTDTMVAGTLQREAAFALRHLSLTVRGGSALAWDAGATRLTVTIPTSFETPGVTRGEAYWRDAGANTFRWAPDASNLGTFQVLAQNVTGFGSTLLNGDSAVQVTLTVANGSRAYTVTTTAACRGRLPNSN